MKDIFPGEFDARLWRLRYDCSWSITRIARRLNISPATVSRRLNQLQLERQGYRYRHRPNPTRRKFRPISLTSVFNA